ncbi:MAG: hypothetical protein ACRCZ5_09165 [Burkholderiales bacterium]
MAAQPAKILLFISNDSLAAYGWRRRTLSLLGRFQPTPEGRAAFDVLIAGFARIPHYVLLDVVEEDFHTETIPHVYGRDRKALLARKRQQHFRGSHYSNAWLQGREPDGRRDDRVLLSGLLNDELVDGWLNCLQRRQVPLAAVCSMALLCVSVVKRFNPDAEHVLLVTEEAGSGIRQSYYKNGELKFSRLTALQDVDEAELGPKIIAESRRTRQYLASLRLLGRDDVLSTLVLCHADNRERLQEACVRSEGIDFHFMALEDVAAALRLHYPGSISVAELLLQLLAKRGRRNHYAPPARRRHFWLWQLGRGLVFASVLVVLLGGVTAAWLLQQSQETASATQILLSQAQRAERQKQQNVLPVSDLPSPAVMRQAVNRIDLAQQRWPSMTQQLLHLSQLLSRYEALHLSEIAWAVSTDESFVTDTPAQGTQQQAGVADTVPAAGDGSEAAPSGDAGPIRRNELVRVRGTVQPFTDNYRFALDTIQQFAGQWARDNAAQVRQLKLPIDIKPSQTIDLEQLRQGREQEHTDFELLLVRPLPVEGGQ